MYAMFGDKIVNSGIAQLLVGTHRYVKKTQSCFQDLQDFLNVTNLHLEPSLKSVKAGVYHCSNVLQTRIIDTNPAGEQLFKSLGEDSRKQYSRLKNKDGLKQEWQFDLAEHYHLKVCGFVHAFAPSILTQTAINRTHAKYQSLKKQLNNQVVTMNSATQIKKELEIVKKELAHVASSFSTLDFLHYRFWFFDLDYDKFINFYEVYDMLEMIGLAPYLVCAVQTSETKYHLYFKSEMICTEDHMLNWPTAPSIFDLCNLNKGNLSDLAKRSPRYSGKDWFKVAMRGVPCASRLDDIPIPIPEEAKLVDGYYFGDRDVYNSYHTSWYNICAFLKADTTTNTETRIAQLPGYSNPKNLYQTHIVYHNRDAEVLTTKTARETIVPNIANFERNTGYKNGYDYKLSQPCIRKPEVYVRCNIDKSGIDTIGNPCDPRYSKGGIENLIKLDEAHEIATKEAFAKRAKEAREAAAAIESQKRAVTSPTTPPRAKPAAMSTPDKKVRSKWSKSDRLPSDWVDYCRLNGLIREVIWDKDITGNSNRMLLLLCRYVKKYIRLDDVHQQQLYFNQIILPYFMGRNSKNLRNYNWEKDFFNRFLTICKLAKKDLEIYLSSADLKPKDVINTNNVKVVFEQDIADKFGRLNDVLMNDNHKKLRRVIYDAVGKTGTIVQKDDSVAIEFFIPREVMQEKVGGAYRDLLRDYERMGIYKVAYHYIRPYIDENHVYNPGKCKKHTIYLKCDKKVIVSHETMLVKKRLSKEENRLESSNILKKILEKKLAKKKKVSTHAGTKTG
jgi:hypothetical protein